MKVNWRVEVEKRKEQILEDVKTFLTIPSVLDEETAKEGKPFGEEVAAALEYMLTKGEEDQFTVKNVDGYAGHIQYGNHEKNVGVLCHVDVVPAGSGWSNPPFDPIIKDVKLYARGAVDDKGPAMASYAALKLIKELNLPLKKNIRLILGGDEESDWRCMDRYFEEEPLPDTGFSPDAEFPIINAEKGIVDVFMDKDHDQKDKSGEPVLQSFQSGNRLNMVPDHASAYLSAGDQKEAWKEAFRTYLHENQYSGRIEDQGRLKIELDGKSVHGLDPARGVNAGVKLAQFLNTLDLDERAQTFVSFLSNIWSDFDGGKAGIAASDEESGALTVNVGKMSYDQTSCHIGLNIRYPVTNEFEPLKNRVEQIANEHGFQFMVHSHNEPHQMKADSHLVQTLLKVYERQTGEKGEVLSTGGGTYARAMKHGVAFGPLFPGREETAHQQDEYIRIEDLLACTAIYAEAMYELAKDE